MSISCRSVTGRYRYDTSFGSVAGWKEQAPSGADDTRGHISHIHIYHYVSRVTAFEQNAAHFSGAGARLGWSLADKVLSDVHSGMLGGAAANLFEGLDSIQQDARAQAVSRARRSGMGLHRVAACQVAWLYLQHTLFLQGIVIARDILDSGMFYCIVITNRQQRS